METGDTDIDELLKSFVLLISFGGGALVLSNKLSNSVEQIVECVERCRIVD